MARQLGFTLLGLLISAAAFGSVAGPAFANAPHYRAQPVAAPGAERVVARDLAWRCGAGGCVAASSNSRPAIVCAALVREVGRLSSFAAGGRVLSAEELQKCNARAR